jgi:hypothetical protein
MSSGVSQIEFWRESSAKPVANESSTNAKDGGNAKEGGEGATYLSYDVFLGLSILGGFFALDHLYLRSPLTFFAKIVINILFFGAWWIYDASQAVFNKDVVKVFGLGVPGLGPKGIAAGVLGSSVPDKKHLAFFGYALALFFGGIFGLDSFLVGDKQTGIIRLVSLITVIFAPIAIGYHLYTLFKFFFKTKDVISEHWEYFGAPAPTTFGQKLFSKFPFLQTIFGPIISLFATTPLKTVVETAVAPFKETANAAIGVVKEGVELGQTALETGKVALETGSEIAGKTLNVIGKTSEAATQALELAPQAAALSNGLTSAAAATALNSLQKGGNASNSNMLAYTLIGTFGIIAVSGFILTYRRSKHNSDQRQNGKQQRDDPPPNPSPPEPRVLSESNKKESY